MDKKIFLTARLKIETADLSDLAALEKIDAECDEYFSFDPPCETNHSCPLKECIVNGDLPPGGRRENYYFFKVLHGDSLVGFLAYYLGHPHPGAAYISVLYIAREYRARGFGSELAAYLTQYFRSLGMTEIRLHVSLRNTMGLKFWVRAGFDRIVRVEPHGNLLPGAFAGVELLRNMYVEPMA